MVTNNATVSKGTVSKLTLFDVLNDVLNANFTVVTCVAGGKDVTVVDPPPPPQPDRQMHRDVITINFTVFIRMSASLFY